MNHRLSCVSAAFLVCAASIPTVSAAIAPPPEASDIVVSAPGGAIDSDEGAALGPAQLQGLARPDLFSALQFHLPGISLADPQGNAWASGFTWRGYGVSALQGTEQGMAVYLDGVRFNQPFGDTLLLDQLPEAALASAELRDASPVYGRNALGGVLLLRSATGWDRPGVTARKWVDDIGSYGGQASISVSGARDALLISLEGINDTGWRRYSPSQLVRGAVALDHRGAAWGIGIRAAGADTDLTGNAVAPIELLDADYRAVFTHPDNSRSRGGHLMALPWVTLSASSRLEASLYLRQLNRRTGSGDLSDITNCTNAPLFLCVEDEDDGEEQALIGSAGSPVMTDAGVDEWGVINRGKERTRSQGFGLQWLHNRETPEGAQRLALGIAWERAKTRFEGTTELGSLSENRAVEGRGLLISSDGGAITPVDLVSQIANLAVYLSAELPLPAGFAIETGVRWDATRVVMEDQIGTALNGRHRFDRVNPMVEVDWQPGSANWSLHLGFAQTSRAPTPAELSCADPERPCALGAFFIADPPLKQVVAQRWALGVRGGSNWRWRAELWRSLSRNEIRQIDSGISGRAYFANGGRGRREGFEASVDRQSGPWQLGIGYAFTKAVYRDGFTAVAPHNPAASDTGTIMVAPGDEMPGIPKHSANVHLGWAAKNWAFSLDMRAQSGPYLFGDEGNENPRLPGYAVINLGARHMLGRGVALALEVRNALNRRYATFGTFSGTDELALEEAPGARDPRAYAPAAPRRIALSLSAQF